MTTIVNEVKATVLALMNSTTLDSDSKYEIYGMDIYDSTVDFMISISYNFLEEMIGSTTIALAANRNKVVACCTDMSAVRIYATLGGISIPTHFNYKNSEMSVTKNVTPMIEQGLKAHMASVKQWFRILMSDTWTAVEQQNDLTFASPIYDDTLGFDRISYDAPLN